MACFLLLTIGNIGCDSFREMEVIFSCKELCFRQGGAIIVFSLKWVWGLVNLGF